LEQGDLDSMPWIVRTFDLALDAQPANRPAPASGWVQRHRDL